MKKIIYYIIMLSSLSSFAMVDSELDILGEGKKIVQLPFPYLHKKSGDQFDVIYQGGFKAYDRDSIPVNGDKIVVLGPLQPCIGIFLTDGKKAVAFHVHYSNSLDHLYQIVQENLELENPENLRGMIYSATPSSTEYSEKMFKDLHEGRTHLQEIKYIKDKFVEKLALTDRTQIGAKIIKPYNADGTARRDLLRYDYAELFMAFSLRAIFHPQEGTSSDSLPCYNIDPCAEDVLKLRGTEVSLEEWVGSNIKLVDDLRNLGLNSMPFNGIMAPATLEQRMRLTKTQHSIALGRLDKIETSYYQAHFGKTAAELFDALGVNSYRVINFYPIYSLEK